MSLDVDRKPTATTDGVVLTARWGRNRRGRIVALTCLALACAAFVASGWEPARAVGGALLACYVPGRLALAALRRPGARSDPAIDHVVAVGLSLVATMLVGALVAGFGLGFTGSRMALLSAVLSAGLGLAALIRTGVGPMPVDAEAGAIAGPKWFSPWVALAALPALVLSAVLAVQLTAYVRHRPATSYYTELSVVAVGGPPVVQVHSRERSAETFRCDQRLDGVLVRQDRFTLHPGRSIRLPLTQAGAGRVEIQLFRGAKGAAYRRLIL
jgi:hypothetical protein